ncbi:MAG: hypothetical protein AAFQ98_08565 [Bacteroidota bacterium]
MNKTGVLLATALVGTLWSCVDPEIPGEEEVEPTQGVQLTLIEGESRLPANVTLFFKADFEDGTPIADLNISDIEIFEDDELISTFEADRDFLRDPGEFNYSTLMLLDLSGSVLDGSALAVLKASADQFVDQVFSEDASETTEIAIYWFDGEKAIHELQDFTSDADLLHDQIASISTGISQDNSTNLHGAVVQGVDIMERRMAIIQGRDSILTAGSILVFTDGKDRAGWVSETEAFSRVNDRAENLSVLSIGLGAEIDQSSLQQIGADGFAFVENLPELAETFAQTAASVRGEANSFYIFQYCSPKRQGMFTLRIDATKDGQTGKLETTFSADGFQGGCNVGSR